jgi:hypothetical protein
MNFARRAIARSEPIDFDTTNGQPAGLSLRMPGNQRKYQREDIMPESLVTMSIAIVILSAGSLAPISAQAGSTTSTAAESGPHHRHHVRTTWHAAPRSNFTSFSSSSGLNVGVNHPAKK